ncbi:hypothetical protein RP20_CCG015773 [Aedes albopictus]|nr:protein bunched, class 1/class 3/D/E isoforms-like isoform X4 [Aedes albopictus]KXJ84225.1 hypothetical protein RP20_CCG015773 [Aedes albopictus]
METVALQQNLHQHRHQAHHRGAVQPENWLYEIKQKGQDSTNTCYVMVQNVRDLVKSHLMFAVREEVEVLKEKISELMDRINQLEYENNILKQNASQETLSQLTTGGGGGASNTSTTAAAAAVVAAAAAAAAATAAAAASASAPSAPVPASKGPTSAATNPSSNGSVS